MEPQSSPPPPHAGSTAHNFEQRVSTHDPRNTQAVASTPAATQDVLRNISEAVQDAYRLLGGSGPQVSALTRKRHTERTLDRLAETKESLKDLHSYLVDLTAQFNKTSDALNHEMAARQEAQQQVTELEQELASSQQHLETTEAARLALQVDMATLQERCAGLVGENRLLREQLAASVESIKSTEERASLALQQATADSQAALAQQAEARRAIESASDSVALIESLTQRVSSYEERASRSAEALARVTADNVGLIVKTRRAEEETASLRRECHELRMAVEEQQGPWFDAMRAETEKRMVESLRKLEASDEATERERQQRLENERAWTAEQSRMETLLREYEEREVSLTTMLAASQASETRAIESCQEATETALAASKERETACAEYRVCLGQIEHLRNELATARATLANLEDRTLTLTNELRDAVEAERAAKMEMEEQVAMNGVLMKAKEAVEWQLMRIQARGKTLLQEGNVDKENVHHQGPSKWNTEVDEVQNVLDALST